MQTTRSRAVAVISSLILIGVGVATVGGGQCLPPCFCPTCHVVASTVEPCDFVAAPCELTFELYCNLLSPDQFVPVPADWTLAGLLPPGLHFSGGQVTTATVSGIPTTAGTFPMFDVDAQLQCLWGIGETLTIAPEPVTAFPMAVDARAVPGSNSNTNGVLEPGETVQVDPSWENALTGAPQEITGIASNLGGPGGPTYTINDGTADYGTINVGTTNDCNGTTGDCYLMTVSGARPAPHWDATFTEQLSLDSFTKTWQLHVGESFPDVPTSDPSYPFVENLFHNGVTGGCLGGGYCPANPVTRGEMAVFVLKGEHGGTYTPPACWDTVFTDDPCPGGPFVAWVNRLAAEGITGGCGGANYCPSAAVTRAAMAVFLLKGEHGATYKPAPCAGTMFTDEPCPGGPFVDWVNSLASEGITSGCGNGNYCPNDPVTRADMAAFLVKTFRLRLYGP